METKLKAKKNLVNSEKESDKRSKAIILIKGGALDKSNVTRQQIFEILQ